MTYQTFFPATEAERVLWLINFLQMLLLYGAAVGIPSEEIKTMSDEIQFAIWVMQHLNPAAQQFALENSAYKTSILMDANAGILPLPTFTVFDNPPPPCAAGIFPRVFNLVRRIKLSTGYSSAIGQAFGIIGGLDNIEHPVPEYSLTLEQGHNGSHVRISFTKYGHDAVSIESRRNGADWENIGVALGKPWYDDRALLVAGIPEVREYRLRWHDKRGVGTTYSAVQKITVGP